MDLTAASTLAYTLMAEHGLIEKNWMFSFDNAERRMGVCRIQRRHISLSRAYTLSASEAEVRNTILHEIAHALVGVTKKRVGNRYVTEAHGPAWKAKAIAIGCTGQRCGTNPYYRAKKAAEAEAIMAEAGVTKAEPAFEAYGDRFLPLASRGDRIVTAGGTTGIIIEPRRAKYLFLNEAGEHRIIGFNYVWFIEGGRGANAPIPAVPSARSAATPQRKADDFERMMESLIGPAPVITGVGTTQATPTRRAGKGDTIRSTVSGRIGVVTSVGRTRYHYTETKTGNGYTVPFDCAVVVAAGTAPATEPRSTTPDLALRSPVVIWKPGSRKYHGLTGVIVKVNETTYKVEVPGRGIITAPKDMVRVASNTAAAASQG